ncbi:MAG: hypothetical protein ABI992_06320 [Chthoniobacterales bacterium]
MRNAFSIPALVGAALFFLLAACSGPRDRIVGKWQMQGEGRGGTVWEFSRNGTVKTGDAVGKYTFGDRGRCKMQMPTATFIYDIEFADQTMTWTDPRGARTELKRVP